MNIDRYPGGPNETPTPPPSGVPGGGWAPPPAFGHLSIFLEQLDQLYYIFLRAWVYAHIFVYI